MSIYLEKPGYKNTDNVINIVVDECKKREIKQVVVASTKGTTGLLAAKALKGLTEKTVIVTHNYGFKEPDTLEMSPETRQEIESFGAKVFTGTMAFRNIGTAIRGKTGYSEQDLIANTLRLFGQGMKVCVEIVLMAQDAGLIDSRDCIAIAGTAHGADTAVIIKPAPSNRLFDVKVREILVKPRDW